jgi:hypothetical protein
VWSTENEPYNLLTIDWWMGKDLDYIIIGIDRLDEFHSVPAIDILPDSLAAS